MPKNKLFEEESEDEVTFKTSNEYAKRYDKWREKEELHKLEQKYGSKTLTGSDESSDSEDESDEPPEVSEEMETQFLKTLALLKTKDPRIYDPNFKFFDEKAENKEESKPKAKTLTFEDSDESEDDGNIFTIEKKAEIVTEKRTDKKDSEEPALKDYLTGKAEHINTDAEKDLAPLKALWSDPKLHESEAFLRDYILNKKYLEEDSTPADKVLDDEALEEDEKLIEEQGKFERAYNFRFEEPDDEYLKRFPRTMNSIRPKDDRRSRKRAEIRSRKEEEKRRKMEEIARMKALKLKEIQEKISKIKEVTGNKDLAFEEQDIEGDFDPEEHDRRMKAIFDEQYYTEADDSKPVFPELDDELEIENWERFEKDDDDDDKEPGDDEQHCEDDDFNMDADYDPKAQRATLLQEIEKTLGKKRRNRKKKSKLAKILSEEKPKFVPTVDKTYDEYMEEYYKMDCEDVIGGDLPTRFKYRQVVPNDYGLSIEEILLADDKELTQWVPLKKIVRHRPAEVERSEVHNYRQKASDVTLKRRVLPSLFKELPEEPEIAVPLEETIKKKKKKKKNKRKEKGTDSTEQNIDNQTEQQTIDNDNEAIDIGQEQSVESEENNTKRKKKKHKQKEIVQIEDNDEIVEENNELTKESDASSETNKKTKKKKHKMNNEIETVTEDKDSNDNMNESNQIANGVGNKNISKKTKKQKICEFTVESVDAGPSKVGSVETPKNKNLKRKLEDKSPVPNKKKKNKANKKDFTAKNKGKIPEKDNVKRPSNPLTNLSDERLKAYGLNPKKYRSFLKYKKF